MAGLTFAFVSPVTYCQMNSKRSNEGGWEKSKLREWLNGDFLAEWLPNDLREAIRPVCKPTNNKGFTISYTDVTMTSDRIWLLSRIELAGSWNATAFWPEPPETPFYDRIANSEGFQYQLFTQLGVHDPYGLEDPEYRPMRPIIAYNEDMDPVRYWLRSPDADVNSRFGVVETDGRIENGYSATGIYGVVPAFCL